MHEGAWSLAPRRNMAPRARNMAPRAKVLVLRMLLSPRAARGSSSPQRRRRAARDCQPIRTAASILGMSSVEMLNAPIPAPSKTTGTSPIAGLRAASAALASYQVRAAAADFAPLRGADRRRGALRPVPRAAAPVPPRRADSAASARAGGAAGGRNVGLAGCLAPVGGQDSGGQGGAGQGVGTRLTCVLLNTCQLYFK